MTRLLLFGLLTMECLSTAASAQHSWPRFRGPNADGVAPDHSGLPTTWTTTDNVKWVADVPGWGWSNPIVCGDHVFLTSVVSDEDNPTPSKGLYQGEGVREPAKGLHHWMVHCLDLNTGQQLWNREAHAGRPTVPRHPKSTYASETPTTDGERLYVLFGDLGLYCYDLDGQPLWSQPIEPKRTFLDYGAAASPVVHDGQVIVVYDNLEDSWIAAFDAKTGEQRWRTTRDETHSWATPFVWQNELRTEIVVPGKKRNRSYSLDGGLLWEFDGLMSHLVIPSPFAAHGLCYIASGYVGDAHRPTFAVRPGATGHIAPDGNFEDSEYIAWYQAKASPYNPSQIVYGDYLYTLFDQGFLSCHDATTGQEVYGKTRFAPSGSFTASPFAFNGHVFFLSEVGLTYVIKAGPEFEIVQRNDLDELCLASPAIVGDKLLIRTASKLYCISAGAKLDAAEQARLLPRKSAKSELTNIALETARSADALPVPNAQQLVWQRHEFIAFAHFGINTFTDREWGEGNEDPKLFNPSDFDARQWAEVLQHAGVRLLILTAKHHDGFCLWPSQWTEHCVKNSPWRGGQGDVVREVVDALREKQIRVGLYLSPWDRNQPTYGDSPRYNQYFLNQLRELLTNYGEIDEVWFDGACGEGPNGKRQEYDWPAYYGLIRQLQPNALIAITGPDIRWVGNESGVARENESSVATRDGQLVWYPAECDVSIRPGWFYHPHEDAQVKSLAHLADIYFQSVGRNSVLLLNIPPDRRGRIADADVARLREFRALVDQLNATDFAATAAATASSRRDASHAESHLQDGNLSTVWSPAQGETVGHVEFDLGAPQSFNVARLQEDVSLGERVQAYHIEVFEDGQWRTITDGQVIGHKQLRRFPTVTTQRVRLVIDKATAPPVIAEFGLHVNPLVPANE